MDQTDQVVLNRTSGFTSPRHPCIVSAELLSRLIALFDTYSVESTQQVTPDAILLIRSSQGYQELMHHVGELANVEIDPHMDHNHRLALYLNLFNLLVMHSLIVLGLPTRRSQRMFIYQKCAYKVGPLGTLCAFELEHAVLRAQMGKVLSPVENRGTGRLPTSVTIGAAHLGVIKSVRDSVTPTPIPSFHRDNPKRAYVLQKPEPLLCFGMNMGCRSSPRTKVFYPETVQQELQESARRYIRAFVTINLVGRRVMLPRLLDVYKTDFVSSTSNPSPTQVLLWAAAYLDGSARTAVQRMVMANENYVRYVEYDFAMFYYQSASQANNDTVSYDKILADMGEEGRVLGEILGQMRNQVGGIPVRDRRHRFTKFRRCFTGTDAVNWLVKNRNLADRAEACTIMRQLVDIGAISSDSAVKWFNDSKSNYYRFETSENELQQLTEYFMKLRAVEPKDLVKTRMHHGRFFRRVFVGNIFIDFMMKALQFSSRAEAVALANRLLDNAFISHVHAKGPFEDENYLYRFNRIEIQGSNIIMLPAISPKKKELTKMKSRENLDYEDDGENQNDGEGPFYEDDGDGVSEGSSLEEGMLEEGQTASEDTDSSEYDSEEMAESEPIDHLVIADYARDKRAASSSPVRLSRSNSDRGDQERKRSHSQEHRSRSQDPPARMVIKEDLIEQKHPILVSVPSGSGSSPRPSPVPVGNFYDEGNKNKNRFAIGNKIGAGLRSFKKGEYRAGLQNFRVGGSHVRADSRPEMKSEKERTNSENLALSQQAADRFLFEQQQQQQQYQQQPIISKKAPPSPLDKGLNGERGNSDKEDASGRGDRPSPAHSSSSSFFPQSKISPLERVSESHNTGCSSSSGSSSKTPLHSSTAASTAALSSLDLSAPLASSSRKSQSLKPPLHKFGPREEIILAPAHHSGSTPTCGNGTTNSVKFAGGEKSSSKKTGRSLADREKTEKERNEKVKENRDSRREKEERYERGTLASPLGSSVLRFREHENGPQPRTTLKIEWSGYSLVLFALIVGMLIGTLSVGILLLAGTSPSTAILGSLVIDLSVAAGALGTVLVFSAQPGTLSFASLSSSSANAAAAAVASPTSSVSSSHYGTPTFSSHHSARSSVYDYSPEVVPTRRPHSSDVHYASATSPVHTSSSHSSSSTAAAAVTAPTHHNVPTTISPVTAASSLSYHNNFAVTPSASSLASSSAAAGGAVSFPSSSSSASSVSSAHTQLSPSSSSTLVTSSTSSTSTAAAPSLTLTPSLSPFSTPPFHTTKGDLPSLDSENASIATPEFSSIPKHDPSPIVLREEHTGTDSDDTMREEHTHFHEAPKTPSRVDYMPANRKNSEEELPPHRGLERGPSIGVMEDTSAISDNDAQWGSKEAAFQVSDNPLVYPHVLLDLASLRAAGEGPRVLYVNEPVPLPLNTPAFEGKMIIKSQTDPMAAPFAPYFKKFPNRQVELQIQGQFKRGNEGRIYMGVEFPNSCNFNIIKKGSFKFILTLLSRFQRGLDYSFDKTGDGGTLVLPHLAFPLTQAMDRLIDTPPGKTPPPLGVMPFPSIGSDRKTAPPDKLFEPGTLYSMSFHSCNLDLVRGKVVNLPSGFKEVDISKTMNQNQMRLVAYELLPSTNTSEGHTERRKRYIFNVEAQFKEGDRKSVV